MVPTRALRSTISCSVGCGLYSNITGYSAEHVEYKKRKSIYQESVLMVFEGKEHKLDKRGLPVRCLNEELHSEGTESIHSNRDFRGDRQRLLRRLEQLERVPAPPTPKTFTPPMSLPHRHCRVMWDTSIPIPWYYDVKKNKLTS
jgi:hypothetical protein